MTQTVYKPLLALTTHKKKLLPRARSSKVRVLTCSPGEEEAVGALGLADDQPPQDHLADFGLVGL